MTRAPDAGWMKHGDSAGRCSTCGKLRFTTRRAAKAFARERHPGQRMNAYKCHDYWHIGHIPSIIVSGTVARSEYRRRPGLRR